MNERQVKSESAAVVPMAAPLPISPFVAETGGGMVQELPENIPLWAEAIPLYDKNPPPAYPRLALVRGWQGEVMLRVRVVADGTVSAVDIEQSSGHAILDRTALDAVRKWRFIPAQRSGVPVDAEVLVPVPFRLRSR